MNRKYHEMDSFYLSEKAVSKKGVLNRISYKWLIKIILFAAFIVCAVIIAFSSSNIIQAEEEADSHKYYTSIMINPGDSLWSIAQKYIDGHYSSIQEYIDEVKAINNLSSDTIHAYEYLLVVYYGDAV